MPKHSKTLHKEFIQKLRALDSTRRNFERAFQLNIINDNDISQAYAGLYLDIFTEFESLLEKLFLGLLMNKIKHSNSSVLIKVQISPKSEIENIVFSGKSYLDWLPYPKYTIERSHLYFTEGKPFSLLEQPEKDSLDKFHKIRNAIAHKSKKALKDFNTIISGSILLPHEKTPQGFLRSIPNRATGKTQLEIISEQLKIITYKLCNQLT